MKWNSRIRCALVCLGFTALLRYSVLLAHLQMTKHDEYAGLLLKNTSTNNLFLPTGVILDANNEVLAHNIPVRQS